MRANTRDCLFVQVHKTAFRCLIHAVSLCIFARETTISDLMTYNLRDDRRAVTKSHAIGTDLSDIYLLNYICISLAFCYWLSHRNSIQYN